MESCQFYYNETFYAYIHCSERKGNKNVLWEKGWDGMVWLSVTKTNSRNCKEIWLGCVRPQTHTHLHRVYDNGQYKKGEKPYVISQTKT